MFPCLRPVTSLLGMLVLAAWGARGQGAPLAPRPDWRERWVPTVPVSGGVRVGLMESLPAASAAGASFSVLLPQSVPPALCVQITAQDGRYTATLEYDLASAAPGTVHLQFPTRYRAELAGHYRSGQLAVLARGTTSCVVPGGPFLVASWRERPVFDSLFVLVNSHWLTDLQIPDTSRAVSVVGCPEIEGTPAVAFNRACAVPMARVRHNPTVNIRRRRVGAVLDPVPLPLGVR